MPNRSRVRSHRLRLPPWASARAIDQRVRPTPTERIGSGGKGMRLGPDELQPGQLGLLPGQQVEHHPGPEAGRPDAEPGVARRRGHPPSWERSKKAQNREQVSMAPAQEWVNRTSSSCGKVSAKSVGQLDEGGRGAARGTGPSRCRSGRWRRSRRRGCGRRPSAGSRGTGCHCPRCPGAAPSRWPPVGRGSAARSSGRSRRPGRCIAEPPDAVTGRRWCPGPPGR